MLLAGILHEKIEMLWGSLTLAVYDGNTCSFARFMEPFPECLAERQGMRIMSSQLELLFDGHSN
jgi:hypothetical protein